MRRLFLTATVLLLASTMSVASADQSVSIVGTLEGFQPAAVTINQGETITWTNNDEAAHTVRSGSANFQSDTLDQGDTFAFTFNQSGSFPYDCSFHPTTMRGTVTVRAQGAPTSPPPSPPPSPQPSPSPSPSPRPSPTPSPTVTPSPSPTSSPTPTASPTVTGTVLAEPDEEDDEEGGSVARVIAWVAAIVAAVSAAGLWYLRKTPA